MRGGCERNRAKNWKRGEGGGEGGRYDNAKKGKEIEREETRKRRWREEGDVGGKVRRRGRTEWTENRREKWGIYKEGDIGREVEEKERIENELECKRAIETVREKEIEKQRRSLELSRRLCQCAWQSFVSGSPWPNHSASPVSSRGAVWLVDYFLRTVSYNSIIFAS